MWKRRNVTKSGLKKSVASRGNTNDMQTKTNEYQEVVRLLYNGASVRIESIVPVEVTSHARSPRLGSPNTAATLGWQISMANTVNNRYNLGTIIDNDSSDACTRISRSLTRISILRTRH